MNTAKPLLSMKPVGPILAQLSIEVEAAIERIVSHPNSWRVIEQDVRRCLTHTFPYGILYSIESNSILIIAVMHLHRSPGYWRERLSGNL